MAARRRARLDSIGHAERLLICLERDERIGEATKGLETLVETNFDAETENAIEMQREGWQAILSNFRKRAEQIAGS